MYTRNISGNFDSAESELSVVRKLMDKYGVAYTKIEKCQDADAGDVVVTAYGKEIIIEVKEEDYLKRFKHYGELGLDFISVFHFKPGVDRGKWSGVKTHEKYKNFFADMDNDRHPKYGKIYYSKSHLWLFYSMHNGEFMYERFFDGKAMTSPEFRQYLFDTCQFTVNNKSDNQLSKYDKFQSAVIFIKGENGFLNRFRVDDLKSFIQSV